MKKILFKYSIRLFVITVRAARRLGQKFFPFADRRSNFHSPSFDKLDGMRIIRRTGIHIVRKAFSRTYDAPENKSCALLKREGERRIGLPQSGPHAYL